MILGVLFINNVNETQGEEISSYISIFLEKIKDNASLDYMQIFFTSVRQNLILAVLLWFAGLTVVGVFAVYGIICFRGFCLGYSVSSIIATIGIKGGSTFVMSTMFLQNIIFIPCIFVMAISRDKII